MGYPYDNDDDYMYGLTEEQIRARMNYAINGDDDDDSLDYGDLNDLSEDESDDDE